MVKVKVTFISGIPTILPWTACTVGGTEGRGGRGGGGGGEGGEEEEEEEEEEETTHDSSSAVCTVVCWWMRPEVQLVQVAGVAGLQCIWWCVVEGLLQYLVQ